MAKCDPICAERGIPSHLHTGERQPNQAFEENELLYIRFRVETRKLKSVIGFRHQSASRSVLCEGGPDDTLFNCEEGGRYENWGVAQVPVWKVLSIKEMLEERSFSLHAIHKPTQCNYAHAEIVAHEGDAEVGDIGPKSVKKKIREALHESITVALPVAEAGAKFEND